jgi:hypothetical protein
MAACQIELTALPILTGCPGAGETMLVTNAVGGLDSNGNYTTGYARRYWSDLAKCAVGLMAWVYTQFNVGSGGALISAGSTTITISAPNFISNSLVIFLGGVLLPINDSTQTSYTYTYSGGNINITFNEAAQTTQQYTIIYANT